MIEVELTMELHLSVAEEVDNLTVDDHLGLVMEELVKLAARDCGIADPAISFDRSQGIVTIEVSAADGDFDQAVVVADSCIRTAIHAAGGATPGWTLEKRSQHAELADA